MPIVDKYPRSSQSDVVFDYIGKHCIFRAPDAQLIARNGGRLSWLIDLRPAFLNAHVLDLITTAFWNDYKGVLPVQVGGMEVGAIPLVTALLLKAFELKIEVNGFIIRKQRKVDGRGLAIEGAIGDAPILLVDDTCNSGSSFAKAIAVVEAHGHHVRQVFSVIDYKSTKGLAWRQEAGLSSTCMFELSEFGLSVGGSKVKMETRTPTAGYRRLWKFVAKGGHAFSVVPKSTPVMINGVLVFGTDSGIVYAVDAQNGTMRWQRKLPNTGRKGIWSSPAVHDGKVFIGAYNGNVYALKADDGEIAWCNHACDWVGSSPVVVPQHGLLSIGLEYERPAMRGSIAALDIEGGRKIWEFPLVQYQHGSSTYHKECDSLITGTNDHNVIALEAATGKEIWRFETRRSVKYPPVVDAERGLVAFASSDASIYVLDASSGKKLAEVETGDLCYTTPLVAGDKLFCGSGDKHLYVLDLQDFTLRAKINLGARVYAPPRLVNGQVVVGTTGGVLFLIDPNDLVVEGKITHAESITNAVVDGGARLYVPTLMNELYCYLRVGGG